MDKMTDSDQTIAMRRAKRIKKRNAAEKRFKWYGRLSIAFGMACVLFLFTDIVSKGIGAFTQTYINVDIEFNAESLSLSIDSTEEEIRSASFNSFFKKTLREQYPEAKSRKEKRQLYGLFSSDMPLILRDMVINNPNIIGTTQTVSMIADDDLMNDLNVATKTIPSPLILARLKDAGEAAADAFLSNHKKDIGKRSTVNLTEMFS